MVKKEYFIITQGSLYRDPSTEEFLLYYDRQYINAIFMLAGAVLIIAAMM
jgi:hypothetical protein